MNLTLRQGHCTAIGFGLSAILMLPSSWAYASTPGFDCSKNAGPAEKIICKDQELSSYDRRLNEAYGKLSGHFSPQEKEKLKIAQRAWIKERAACASKPDSMRAIQCIRALYFDRLDEFEKRLSEFDPQKLTLEDSEIVKCPDAMERYHLSSTDIRQQKWAVDKDEELNKIKSGTTDCGSLIAANKSNRSSRDDLMLGYCYAYGLGLPKDITKAVSYLQDGAKCGDVFASKAAALLGSLYDNGSFPRLGQSVAPLKGYGSSGTEVQVDKEKAFALYKRSVEIDGWSDAKYRYEQLSADKICDAADDVPDDCDLIELAHNAKSGEKAAKKAFACACSIGGMAPAEFECAVGRLKDMISSKDYDDVNLCDCQMGGSGGLTGLCSARVVDDADRGEKAFFDKLTAESGESARAASEKLREATKVYIDARVAWGQYTEGWGGTGAPSRWAQAIASEKTGFVEMAKKIQKNIGSISEGPEKLKSVDQRLNKIYSECQRKQRANPNALGPFQEWERKWLKYRDAWLDFAVTRVREKNQPGFDAARLRNGLARQLTEQQISNLEHSCGNDGE